jgi:hypothetical protein
MGWGGMGVALRRLTALEGPEVIFWMNLLISLRERIIFPGTSILCFSWFGVVFAKIMSSFSRDLSFPQH